MSLEDLRALAEAATPGPWDAYFTQHGDPLVVQAGRGWFGAITVEPGDEDRDLSIVTRGATSAVDYGRANCQFIAAANPSVVAALVDELAEYRALGPLPSLRVAIARSEAQEEAIFTTRSVQSRCPHMERHHGESAVPHPCADCYSIETLSRRLPWQPDERWHPVIARLRSAGHPTEPPTSSTDCAHEYWTSPSPSPTGWHCTDCGAHMTPPRPTEGEPG